MSTPSEKIALYYRVTKNRIWHRAVRWLAAKLGFISVPQAYVSWLLAAAIHQTNLSRIKNVLNPCESKECKARADVYKSLSEEIAAFRDYKKK